MSFLRRRRRPEDADRVPKLPPVGQLSAAERAAKLPPEHKSGRTSRAGHASAAEQRYATAVAELGCILCRHLGFPGTPAELHHPKDGVYGAGMRSSNWDVIPLCPEHHRGNTGWHVLQAERFFAAYAITEGQLGVWVKHLMRDWIEREGADA